MRTKSLQSAVSAAAILLVSLSAGMQPAAASDLTYQPKIPAFGGSPLLDNYFISTAQIQNQHADSGGGGGSSAPVINFPPITIDLGGAADAAASGASTPAE